MTDILTKLAALTAKDENGLLSCPLCGHEGFLHRKLFGKDGREVSYVTFCSNKACVTRGHKECLTPNSAAAFWNTRPREAALIALVQEAVVEIERLKQWQAVGLAIGARQQERLEAKVINPQEQTDA